MSRIHRQASTLGLATTLVMVVLFVFGAFDPWEHKSIDMRFATARVEAEPMSNVIAHVDIDDGSIDSIGRWPWPRSRLAAAVEELGRAGARVVVLDLILEEPSTDSEEDEALAEAMTRVPTVVGVRTSASWGFDNAWETPEGAAERARLFKLLQKEIAIDPETAAREAKLSSVRGSRFVERPNLFKQVAIWQYLRARMEHDDPPASAEQLMRELSPDFSRGMHVQEFALVEDAWTRYASWKALDRFLPGERSEALSRDLAPTVPIAQQAAMAGFVDADPDIDGAVRWTRPGLTTTGGSAPPLGMAAYLAYRGLDPRQVVHDEDHIRVGDRVMPLENNRLWLYWPTSDVHPRWEGLLRRFPTDTKKVGHVPLGWVAQLAEQRVKLAESRAQLREIARGMLGREFPEDVVFDEALLGEIRDEVEWQLDSFPPDVKLDDLDEAALKTWNECKAFPLLVEAIPYGEKYIPEKAAKLRAMLNDKLVFLGYTSTGTMVDRHPTAVGTHTPGVIAHAVLADMLIQNRHIDFLPYAARVLLTALLGLITTLLAVRFSGILSGLLTIMVLGAYVLIGGLLLFDSMQLIVPLAGPITTGACAWLICTAFESAMFQRDRLRITRQFKARVSGQLVDYLIENPEAVSMSGDERDVTVLFCDLANFTSISESLGGPATVSMLNRYMGRLTELLIEHRGYVNKFLGDGLMAFWSAFAYDAEQAGHACRAVVECHLALRELNEHPDFAQFPNLDMRAGITTGHVIVGDCGAPPHLNDYTVIGDAVNLAARLEAANKQFGTNILIDGRTHDLIKDDPAMCARFLGRVAVVGQSRPVLLYELLASPCDREDRELCGRAASAFMDGEIIESQQMWNEYAERFGRRPFVDLYLDAISREGPAATGVLILQSK